jgi:hypothetical protein
MGCQPATFVGACLENHLSNSFCNWLQHSVTDTDLHIAQSASPACLCAHTRAVVTCAHSTLTVIHVQGFACIDYFPHIARPTLIHTQHTRTTSMQHTSLQRVPAATACRGPCCAKRTVMLPHAPIRIGYTGTQHVHLAGTK